MKTRNITLGLVGRELRKELSRWPYFFRTGYYPSTERVNPDFPDENFKNHFRVYQFVKQFAVGKDVLDVGCGTGYGTAYLGSVARSITGVDISYSALNWACKRYPHVNFKEMDVHKLEFPNKSFDLIVSTENFEHLHNQRTHTKELARTLRSDGVCFIGTPNPEMSIENYNRFHTKENTFSELRSILDEFFDDVTILENTLLPETEKGRAMREARISRGEVGISNLASVDTTYLSNTHSFLCFCRKPSMKAALS